MIIIGFATRVLQQPNGPTPRNGKKTDQAHPPIHPTKFDNLNGLSGMFLTIVLSIYIIYTNVHVN